MSQSQQISMLVSAFVDNLTEIIDTNARERAIFAITYGTNQDTRKNDRSSTSTDGLNKRVIKSRRKGPIQLCPVPGCKMRAAPVFGMVCSDHKDLPKAKIKAFRLARKAEKSGDKKTAKILRRAAKKPKKAKPKTTAKKTKPAKK